MKLRKHRGFWMLWVCILYQIGGPQLRAQNKKIDSLRLALQTAGEDTNKVIIWNELSNSYRMLGKYDSSILLSKYAGRLSIDLKYFKGIGIALGNWGQTCYKQSKYDEALEKMNISLKIFDLLRYKRGISNIYINIGLVNFEQGNYQVALKKLNYGLQICVEIGDKRGMAMAYNNLGLVYSDQGNYPGALKYYLLSLKLKEEIGDKKGISYTYNNIGNICSSQGNYNEALKNFFASLALKKEVGDKKGQANAYGSIGNAYSNMENFSESAKYYQISLKISEELKDRSGIAACYNNIGGLYLEQGGRLKDELKSNDLFNKAYQEYLESLRLYRQIGDKSGIAATYLKLGRIFFMLHKLRESQENLLTAFKLAKAIGHLKLQKDAQKWLNKVYNAEGKFKEAFFSYKEFVMLKDSLLNEENTKKTVQLEMTYQFEKKEAASKAEQEKKDAIAGEEKRKQKIILGTVSLGLALVVILALVIFRSLRLNQKKNKIIQAQKQAVELQKHLIEEKQKEILDSIYYARRIQRSLLTSEGYINKKLKNLH